MRTRRPCRDRRRRGGRRGRGMTKLAQIRDDFGAIRERPVALDSRESDRRQRRRIAGGSLTFMCHAAHPGRGSSAAAVGAGAALRSASGSAGPAQDGQALAPGHRTARPAPRAPAPPAGDQRGRRRTGASGRVLPRWPGQPQRGQGVGGGHPPGPGGRRTARLRGGAARPRGRGRPSQARPVRLPGAGPLGRAPLRPVRLLSGMGGRHRQRHLLLRRRGELPAVGAGARSPSVSGRFRPDRCSSSTSPSRIPPPTASSGS